MATILIADDDPAVRAMLRPALEQDGFIVREAADGQAALAAVDHVDPALVLLNLILPTMDGWEVCRRIRAERATPIIVLTTRDAPADQLRCFDLGADAYITKPFSVRDVVARVRAVLYRATDPGRIIGNIIRAGSLTIDLRSQSVKVGDRSANLTSSEFRLLAMLASYPGQVFTRVELIHRIQGHAFTGYARTVDTHIMNLRKKLGGDPSAAEYILTVRGAGYKFSDSTLQLPTPPRSVRSGGGMRCVTHGTTYDRGRDGGEAGLKAGT